MGGGSDTLNILAEPKIIYLIKLFYINFINIKEDVYFII